MAVVLILAGVLLGGFGALLTTTGGTWWCVVVGLTPAAPGLLAAVFPTHGIRLVMGRFAELGQAQRDHRLSDDAPEPPEAQETEPVETLMEGVPAAAVLVEAAFDTKKTRARVGIAAMVLGSIGGVSAWIASIVWEHSLPPALCLRVLLSPQDRWICAPCICV
jgi:hypothetical protein